MNGAATSRAAPLAEHASLFTAFACVQVKCEAVRRKAVDRTPLREPQPNF